MATLRQRQSDGSATVFGRLSSVIAFRQRQSNDAVIGRLSSIITVSGRLSSIIAFLRRLLAAKSFTVTARGLHRKAITIVCWWRI
jgi:hypothetical protein